MKIQKATHRILPAATKPQTPDQVRDVFMQQRIRVGNVELHPVSVATLWMLEKINYPLVTAQNQVEMKTRDAARLIFILLDPEAAENALTDGEKAFDREAIAAARSIDIAGIPEIINAVITQLATMVRARA